MQRTASTRRNRRPQSIEVLMLPCRKLFRQGIVASLVIVCRSLRRSWPDRVGCLARHEYIDAKCIEIGSSLLFAANRQNKACRIPELLSVPR